MEPTTNGIKTWQWVVTVIVIIVLIVVGIIVFGNKSGQTPATTEEPSTTNTQNIGDINRVVMSDQYPGNVVYISSVQLAQPGWVAIAKDNNGQPGAIIGSAHFDKGISPGKITLSQPTVEGGTYYAIIYSDNSSGKFDAAVNQPLKDANGSVIMKIFHATAAAGMELKG